ncbi:MAG: hypothetical protein H6Q10_2640 [Acidobacteria bacterium]|nr:hypothetical protein [Acidobacteriota bacterium]
MIARPGSADGAGDGRPSRRLPHAGILERMGRTLLAALAASALLAAPSGAWAQPSFSPPGLITSVGQSADAAIVKLALNTQYQLGLEYKPQAEVADLAGRKTMVVVIGSTPEGLAASGTDLPAEIARAKALLAAAREAGVGILAMHTGGQARRDKASTQLIELVVPLADYIVVVAGGNQDKLFQKLAAPRGTLVAQVDRVPGVGGAVGAVYKR